MRCSYTVPARALSPADKKALTLTPNKHKRRDAPGPRPAPWSAWSPLRGGAVALPRYYGLAAFGTPTHDLMAEGAPLPPGASFAGTLRGYQEQAVGAVLAQVGGPAGGGAILEAGCGLGKTVMGVALLARLGRKAAVLVHKDFLLEQWRSALAAFLPRARVGVVQGVKDERAADVLLVMIQTAVGARHSAASFADVGVVLVDECHHLCARTFSRAMRRFAGRVRVGLTATAARGDGLGYALPFWLGPCVCRVRRRQAAVRVAMLKHEAAQSPLVLRYGKPAFAEMVTKLAEDPGRNALLETLLRTLVRDGRRVILMGARRALLDTLRAALGDDLCAMYRGETSKAARAAREAGKDSRPILLSTLSMGEEGLDIPRLDTLVLATPRSGAACLEQCVGRILRPHPEKKLTALVVDVWDGVSIFGGMRHRREAFYRRQGYDVRHAATVEDVRRHARAPALPTLGN